MNEKKLKPKQVFKNYKELCIYLNQEVKTGKSKQLQLKDWERYFEWHKEGNKFIIDEVFAKKKQKLDGRANNSGSSSRNKKSTIYGQGLENAIMNDLTSMVAGSTDYFSFSKLFIENIHLFTEEYNEMYDYVSYAKSNGMSKGVVREYYLHIRDKIKLQLEKTLNHLQKNNKITWCKCLMGLFENGSAPQEIENEKIISILKHAEKKIENEKDEEGNFLYSSAKRINPVINRKYKEKVLLYAKQKCDDEILENYIQKLDTWYTTYKITLLEDLELEEFNETEGLQEFTTTLVLQMHKTLMHIKNKEYLQSLDNIDDIERLDSIVLVHYNKDFFSRSNKEYTEKEDKIFLNEEEKKGRGLCKKS